MENLVPLGTGNSRFMKSNISPSTTLAQLIQMLNNGTFPYDIGPLNPAGISQQGTPLNKATLLKDATAALFGFGVDALPDDMFNALAHTGDLHVWKRTQNGQVDYPVSPNRNAYQEGSDGSPAGYTLGAIQNGEFEFGQSNEYNIKIRYSSSISVSDNGVVSLSGSVGTSSRADFAGSSGASLANETLVGKYFSPVNSFGPFSAGKIYFIPSSASFIYKSTSTYTYLSQYQTVTGYAAIPANTTIEYMGQLGSKARIETGSYVGTGKYGSSNPNTLMFGFVPSLVIISYRFNASRVAGVFQGIFTPAIYTSAYSDMGYCYSFDSLNTNCFAKISGNTLYWYANTADHQLNMSGQTFSYTAIG